MRQPGAQTVYAVPVTPRTPDQEPPWRSRRRRWSVWGGGLALGSPLGLMALKVLGRPDPLGAAVLLVREDPLTWAYLTLSTAAVMAALGAQLGARADLLELSSLEDPLTGLGNRRRFDDALGAELDRHRRAGTPLTLLLIDLDRLKQINDRGGHAAGDAAIRAVGEALRGAVRSSDVAARIGGDEFAVLAPNADQAGGVALAQRVRSALAREGGPAISVGVSSAREGDGARELLRRADAALYRAKALGRDRVETEQP